MDLLLNYIIVNPTNYKDDKFRCFTGGIGGPQYVNDPVDTGLGFIKPTDEDVLVFSFMNGAQPLALACVVDTDLAAGGTGRSTGRYFVCKPEIVNNVLTWTLVAGGTNGITLKIVKEEEEEEVAGNPHGVGQFGSDLALVDYDVDDGNATNIYTVGISALLAAGGGGDVTVDATQITAGLPLPPRTPGQGEVFKVHGNGLAILTDNSGNNPVTCLYAQFNGVIEDATTHMPIEYGNGAVVRLLASNLSQQTSVPVGKNAMGLVPLPIPAPGGTTTGLALAVPCYGGVYQYGATNGADSKLYRIDDIFGTMTATAAIVGEDSDVPTEATRDFKSVTFSEDGLFGYVLTITYDTNGFACWKIYQTTAANILGANGLSITAAINKNLLVFLEGSDQGNGSDWEVLYENAANSVDGRLWFVKGSTIRVSQGSLYSVSREFVKLYDDEVDPIKVGYINSADLIGEMIYQYGKGHSIETRLIKGKTVAKIARAAAASAAPADEEDK
jgi:hypothetical protein